MARDLGSLMNQAAAFFSLTNHSDTPCDVEGYPKVALYDTNGVEMPTHVIDGPTYQVNDPGVHAIAVQPGRSVYFALGWWPYRFNPSKGFDGYSGCVRLGRVTITEGTVTLSSLASVRLPFCPPWGVSTTAFAAAESFTIASPVGPNL